MIGIVSVAGYLISEIIVQIVLTFMLLILLFLIKLSVAIAKDGPKLGVYGLPFLLVVLGIVYYFPVRIGTIMFINGIILALLVVDLVELVGILYGFKNSD